MILGEENTIFIHIPKNAGTSIETFFLNSNFNIQPEKHTTIHEIKRKFPEIYNSYRKFTIIRNPYDRIISWYFYLKENAENLMGSDIPTLMSEPSLSSSAIKPITMIDVEFIEWIKKPFKFWPQPPFSHYLDPQHIWLDKTVMILKYENLKKELNEFFEKEINLPITNKTKHDHYSNYYNRESLDIINDRYKEDFEKYNYKKL